MIPRGSTKKWQSESPDIKSNVEKIVMAKKTHLLPGKRRFDRILAPPNDIIGKERMIAERRDTLRWAMNASDGL